MQNNRLPVKVASQATGLSLTDGGISFQGVKAVDGVSLHVGPGEVVGLIGPNGSGKTTTLNLLSGMLRPDSGHVSVDGRDISDTSMRKRIRLGVVRTFQSGRVFPRLTVAENVECAALGMGETRRRARRIVDEVLRSLGLADIAQQRADTLTAGKIRAVAIARALACSPKYLLLDEPAAGQDEAEGIELVASIRDIAGRRGAGVLLVEHDMDVVMNACDRLHVLDSGHTVAEGDPRAVRHDPKVIEIYFGKRGT